VSIGCSRSHPAEPPHATMSGSVGASSLIVAVLHGPHAGQGSSMGEIGVVRSRAVPIVETLSPR